MYFLDSGGTNIPEKKKKKKTLEDPKFLICGVFLLGSPNFYTNCCGEVFGGVKEKGSFSLEKYTQKKKQKSRGDRLNSLCRNPTFVFCVMSIYLFVWGSEIEEFDLVANKKILRGEK